ncbi:MAG: hypothetical protein JJ916_06200 [Phycisphaerales bacterium]|nr:hypothetical protein [Phycisphaerales bacterium]
MSPHQTPWRWLVAAILTALITANASAQPRAIDSFDRLEDWELILADGVRGQLTQGDGTIRLDYDFSAGAGYIVLRKRVQMQIDPNYRFGLRYRGKGPTNTLEFKLIDPSLENVWWSVERNIRFPDDWETQSIRRRHVTFAWGPSGGAPIDTLGAIEIAVTATSGGTGQVWFDELTYEPLPEVEPQPTEPTLIDQHGTKTRVTPNGHAQWHAAPGDSAHLEFASPVEFSAVRVRWAKGSAGRFRIQTSPDATHFTPIAEERVIDTGTQTIFLPESEAKQVRIDVLDHTATLEHIEFSPVEQYPDANAFIHDLAQAAPQGAYPNYYNQLTPWTVIGLPDHDAEALMSETGRLEPRKTGYALEPFILQDSNLLNWADASITQSLMDGALPIPTVHWSLDTLRLDITAVASDLAGPDQLHARYRITNTSKQTQSLALMLAARPFQVLPAAQFLNTVGGAAHAQSLELDRRAIRVDNHEFLRTLTQPDDHLTHAISRGTLTNTLAAESSWTTAPQTETGQFPSGAIRYNLMLQPGASREIDIIMSMTDEPVTPTTTSFDQALAHETTRWEGLLNRFQLLIPESAQPLRDTIRANLAYILINADGPGIRPGSRSYERSWIRDGAMTSAALIALGNQKEARDFIQWYSTYQYADGKIPCVVDSRGPDPVDENDAPGQYLFAIRNSAEAAGHFDTSFARDMYPSILRTVDYVNRMRSSRLTPQYTQATDPITRACAGLMPESISHEGYSEKPMHSYWDDFWVYRGLRDAEAIALRLNEHQDAAHIRQLADEFGYAITQSIERTTQAHAIPYVPGCVELGDFDATSTSIAFYPTGAAELIDPNLLEQTFERAWASTQARIDGSDLWDGMTPYEVRNVGTFVRLGWIDRAHEYMDWLMTLQAPAGWRQWGEIAYREDAPCRFVGDMPHTWVGSGAILSILSLFSYEQDDHLVLAAGIPTEWLDAPHPIGIRGLVTRHGTLSYTIQRTGNTTNLHIDPGCHPPAGYRLKLPDLTESATALTDGKPTPINPDGSITITPETRTVTITE